MVFPFNAVFSKPLKVEEKHHQALLLFTDSDNRVFAAGLNRGNFPSSDTLVLYLVDLVGKSMTADPNEWSSTGRGPLGLGTSLRWGATLEMVGDHLVLHCTARDYDESCDINTFDPAPVQARRTVRTRTGARTEVEQEGRFEERRGNDKRQSAAASRSDRNDPSMTATSSQR